MADRIPHPSDVVADLVAGAVWDAYRSHPLNDALGATDGWLSMRKKAAKGDAEAIRITTLARAEADAALAAIGYLGLVVVPAAADHSMTAIVAKASRQQAGGRPVVARRPRAGRREADMEHHGRARGHPPERNPA
ncbi:MAG: hypothetical protein J0H82_05870 [Alphaproteobacteria bacterium]|jgi:hypothetical protein|nr:hypothetical protein [Alphaproteobacteria bacterium]